ncbi:retinoic acid receptor RXR-gamma-A [Saccoglossus kowalevskii]|uniref:Nuclear receptor subfamily 1 group D member 2 n=2 Tax=Saccoglossus kowalevskii TaxID=10224 RepID=A0ABM0GU20_SACKO|nr:PREDICTED: nuclear receptor subfamily 1 group D member 2 [Saccoglossus kowalevskii]
MAASRSEQEQSVLSNSPAFSSQSTTHAQNEDSLSPSVTTTTELLCLVCSDKGSGYHYSVFSCEGCKGFFKRTVQKQLKYSCKESRNCEITKYSRNSCQSCRFQKCVNMGMKIDAVREDRTPGGKQKIKRSRSHSSSLPVNQSTKKTFPNVSDTNNDTASSSSLTDTNSPQPEKRLKEDSDVSQEDQSKAYETMAELLTAARPDIVPEAQSFKDMSNFGIDDLMQYGYKELQLIIQWARHVPGFRGLLIEDQMALLKASFMELNVLRLAYRSRSENGLVRFGANMKLTKDQAMEIGWGQELIQSTLNYVSRIQEVNVDHVEFCFLNAIVLTYPDAAGLQDKTSVTTLQAKIVDALRHYIKTHYPKDAKRYAKVLLRLPTLRTVASKATERFLSMTLDGTIQINELVSEMMG